MYEFNIKIHRNIDNINIKKDKLVIKNIINIFEILKVVTLFTLIKITSTNQR